MTTQVDDTGLAFLAGLLAGRQVTISVHTNDPGATGADNELGGGAGRNYARKNEAAANWTADASTTDNDNDIEVFTPTATEAGTVVNHIGIWFGAVWYARMELVAPITLVEGEAFTLSAGTVDLFFAR